VRTLFITLGLLATLNASAQSVRAPRLYVLGSGLRIITVEDHNTPLVSAVWSAHVGNSAEPPEPAPSGLCNRSAYPRGTNCTAAIASFSFNRLRPAPGLCPVPVQADEPRIHTREIILK